LKGTNALQNPGDPILIPTHRPSAEVCQRQGTDETVALRFTIEAIVRDVIHSRPWF
jgi:hypothetical protein